MNKKEFKRVFVLLLSIMTVLNLLSGAGSIVAASESVVAVNTTTNETYNDVALALHTAADGETVQMVADVSLAEAITFNRDGIAVTLDLNGHSIVRTVAYAGGETEGDGALYVANGTLTIDDTSAAAEGHIEYLNTEGLSGSGLNIGAGGYVKLLAGGILGTGQSVYAHDAGGRFEMSGGVVYGSGNHPGSEAIAAISGAYITISGGYVGTRHADAAMIWSGATLNPTYWSITGGYFTSQYYNDGAQHEIENFVTEGEVTELVPVRTHSISGATEYKYQLTLPRTISIDANGGESAATSFVTDAFGKLTELPANASKNGAIFTGWYTAVTGGTKITTNYIFERDMTIYAQYSSGGAESPAEPPVLIAEGDNDNNLVKLSWTSSRAGQEYYMVYQKDTGGSGLDEFQSIPLKKDIKVLNVYPDIAGGSDGLQSWMQDYGNPSGYTMQVDKVAISDFNGTDTTKNYAHYLEKDDNGAYTYDVLYFGAWDANNRRDLSDDAHAAVESFIQYGGGVLVGHDTASFNHHNFIDLAQKYLNMEVNFQEGQGNPGFPPYGSSQVAIERRGFPMNYPYALGNVGDVLFTPVSHSYYQFAKGDVWFKFNTLEWGAGPEITSYDGSEGTNNFYLTTWNNVAMIQTGHSNGAATVDEQKILANTLFYLAQVSTANSFDDRMSQDVAAPDSVTGHIAVSAGSSAGKQSIQWNEAQDNGSSYAYYLKAVSFVDGSSYNSSEAAATVTTGVQGYAVTIDTDSSNVDPGNTVTTSTASFETDNLQAGVTYYAHIKVIDQAGNTSNVYTVSFTIDATGLTVTSTDPLGKANDDKTKLTIAETVGQGNKLLYINVGNGALAAPGVGEQLSEESGYQQLPADGLIEAVDGDIVAVVEVDADGKVVRFGQTTAISLPTPDELELRSVDPIGAVNNGKTIISAKAEAGNKLVYVNFGSEAVLSPYKGELLAGYTDLPANGIIQAAHNDHIAVAELDASGRVVRFAVVNAKVIPVNNEPSGSVSVEVDIPETPAPRGVEVLVNGKVEYAGIATLSSDQGQTLTTIDVDQAKLQAKLDEEGMGAVVTIPWSEQSDIVIGKLTGQMVKNMEDKEATLVLATSTGAYKIPTEQIQIAALASQFGENIKLEDIQLQIRIALVAPEAAKAAEGIVTGHGVTLMATPVSFTVKAEYAGVSIEITDYSVYVERTIALPDHMDPNKITTGVVLEPNGTLRHVPTKVTKENETYYAEINSLTNSDYAVIWNPLEFSDVAGHWSEAAVNDMGSRLVVNGVGGGKFNPDANITRAEFAAIIVRGLGLRLDQGTVPFTDLSGSEWYASVVNTAFKFGLIAGYEDGTFRPQGKITRQEAMIIIARAMKITGLSKQWSGLDINQTKTLEVFRDAEAVSNWAKEGVTLSVAAQIVNGRAADMLKPEAFITRAEAAAIVQRLLQKSQLI